jgi:dolichyl-phosphate beta-glucosyltransferase
MVEKFSKTNPNLKLLNNEKNIGKGATVKKGMLSALGRIIYFTDSDLSTPIEELDRFLSEIKDSDIVIGSRAIERSNIMVHEPLYREILGRVFNLAVRLFCVPGFVDTQCGSKMFRSEAAGRIFPLTKISRFAFDVEALYLAYRFGYRIKELPVKWYHSPDTKVRPFLDGPKMLFDLLMIRWSHRKTRWD